MSNMSDIGFNTSIEAFDNYEAECLVQVLEDGVLVYVLADDEIVITL